MKRGWSILLTELVDAVDVGHGDAADFQIVCEICREPVFKTERSTSHFLSHYPSASRWAAECELRVAREIRDLQETGKPSQDRGQSLSHYLSVFAEMASSLFGPPLRMPHVRRGMKSETWGPLRIQIMRRFREMSSNGDLKNLVDLMLTHRGESGSPMRLFVENFEKRFPSTLQRRVQNDIAIEMGHALCTGAAARNLSLLIGIAFVAAGPDLRRNGPLGARAHRMITSDKSTFEATMRELRKAECLDQVVTTILMHAVQIISLIDYVGFLPRADGTTPRATDVGYVWSWRDVEVREDGDFLVPFMKAKAG